jgi:nitrate/nitrite transporter NarK
MTEPESPIRPEPPRTYRWVVLVVISLAMFGNYYVYDSISPLADVLKAQLGFSDANIGLLNAIYSFPNIVMVLLGGIIIDRIGTRKATFLFGVLCFAGALLTVVSGELGVMAAGRLVFGLGAESLIVAVTTAIAKWFRGKELSFAFGVNLTIARLGSFAALNAPSWAAPAYANWRWPLLISVGVATFCITGALAYWILENRAEERYHLGEESTEKVVWSDLFRFGVSYWLVVALCITFYSAIFPFQTFAVKFFIEALFMMFGSVLLVPVYLVMAYTSVPLIVPMVVMGIAFSLIPAVMWPAVAYLVEQSKLGTAYGLMTMIQNVGLFGFNLLIGWANDHWQASSANPGGYTPGMWMFSILGFAGLLFSWLLRVRETGPRAHGLETITTSSPKG